MTYFVFIIIYARSNIRIFRGRRVSPLSSTTKPQAPTHPAEVDTATGSRQRQAQSLPGVVESVL